MHPEANNTPASNMPGLLALRRELECLQKDLSKWEERLDRLIFDMDGLVKQSASSPQPAQPLPKTQAPGLPLRESRRSLQQQACVGAHSVQFTLLADGSARVQIDGRPGLPLPPSVAALFQILKGDGGTRTDQMVGWKTVADIKQALHKSTGWSFTDRAVKELVFRLRRKLEAHGELPYLVQSRRKLGYRLALWRGGDL